MGWHAMLCIPILNGTMKYETKLLDSDLFDSHTKPNLNIISIYLPEQSVQVNTADLNDYNTNTIVLQQS